MDFGLFETHLLLNGPDLNALVGIPPVKTRGLFRVSFSAMFDWLETPEGLSLSLWRCTRGEKPKWWCEKAIEEDEFAHRFIKARNFVSGLGVEFGVDWPVIPKQFLQEDPDDEPDEGDESWKPLYTKTLRVLMETYSLKEMSEWTLYQLRVATSEAKNFDGKISMSKGALQV